MRLAVWCGLLSAPVTQVPFYSVFTVSTGALCVSARVFRNESQEIIFDDFDAVCQLSACMFSSAPCSQGEGMVGSWCGKQCVKSSRSCHVSVGLMQHSDRWVLHRSAPLPCLYAGGVSVCTGLCQLTLICLISTSKSLTSPHANKHIQSSFKPKPLSNTCLISRGPERRCIMHLKKCSAPALQAERSLLPGFYVIALTFSGGRERLPPQHTEVCVSLWAVNRARYCRLGMYTVLLTLP